MDQIEKRWPHTHNSNIGFRLPGWGLDPGEVSRVLFLPFAEGNPTLQISLSVIICPLLG
jgi:hypothetical protein